MAAYTGVEDFYKDYQNQVSIVNHAYPIPVPLKVLAAEMDPSHFQSPPYVLCSINSIPVECFGEIMGIPHAFEMLPPLQYSPSNSPSASEYELDEI